MARTLHTARLVLRPLHEGHLKYIVELDSDPRAMSYVHNGKPFTPEVAKRDLASRLANCDPATGLGYWAGFQGDDFVGWWAISPGSRDGETLLGVAELGFRLLPRYWRQGFAKEGSLKLLRHGFEDLGLKEVIADTMAVNSASRATLTACGLTHTDTIHLQWDDPIPGTEEGETLWSVSRDDWLAWFAQRCTRT